MVGRWHHRPRVADDLHLRLRRICTKLLNFRLEEGIKPWLADSSENDRSSIRRSFLPSGEHDLIAKIAAEILDLVENVFQLRAPSLLLLLPPVTYSGALLQPVVEKPVRLADRVTQVWAGRILRRTVGRDWKKASGETQHV